MAGKNVRLALLALLVVVGFLLTGRPARAQEVTSGTPKFRMTIPDGFKPRPDLNRGDQILTHHRAGITGAQLGAIIAVDRMHGTIGRESPSSNDPKLVAKGITVETAKWKTFDVWVARQAIQVDGRPAVVWLAQVPLKPEAIQLKVLTDASDEAEGRAMLITVLATIEGETNLLTGEERSQRLVEGASRLGLVLGVIIGAVVGVFILRALLRKSSPPVPSYGSFDAPSMSPQVPVSSPGASTKCAKCGLVAFAAAGASCRRCGTPSA